jgi:hypothetical protein
MGEPITKEANSPQLTLTLSSDDWLAIDNILFAAKGLASERLAKDIDRLERELSYQISEAVRQRRSGNTALYSWQSDDVTHCDEAALANAFANGPISRAGILTPDEARATLGEQGSFGTINYDRDRDVWLFQPDPSLKEGVFCTWETTTNDRVTVTLTPPQNEVKIEEAQ